ncbi:hypothetical protein MMC30_004350 [Trapelia coarctata]|nr:hypothetical protein [Trapelia coarctata]
MSKPTMILGTSISITTKVLLQTGITTTKPTSMVLATGVTTKSTSTSTVLMMTMSSKTTVAAAMATAKVVTHVVKVSTLNNTLSFVPNSLVAAPGSLVQFQFFPMNHSVVQAAFSNPCMPINSVQPAVKGIFSGFMPTNGVITPIFTILINDTQPIWYYCSQGMHCQEGMVGVINPSTTQTITQFAAAAKLVTTNITPGMAAPIVPMNPMAPPAPKINATTIAPTFKPSAMPPSSTAKPGNVSATVPGIVRQTGHAAAGASAWGGAGVAGFLAVIAALTL